MDGPVIKGNSISIPSDPEYLAAVDDFLEGTLRGFSVDESTIADIAISVTEIVNNSILHGNKSDTSKIVTLSISRKGSSVSFAVSDEGPGFNPDDIADPLKEENLLKEVGRGIFIARSLMDSVSFDTHDGGSTVTLEKNL